MATPWFVRKRDANCITPWLIHFKVINSALIGCSVCAQWRWCTCTTESVGLTTLKPPSEASILKSFLLLDWDAISSHFRRADSDKSLESCLGPFRRVFGSFFSGNWSCTYLTRRWQGLIRVCKAFHWQIRRKTRDKKWPFLPLQHYIEAATHIKRLRSTLFAT